ncbi:MAG: M20/M25/M40 family metallo-hydrolase [Phycisphaeraceae bacterium]|nr:M20/M25/M40 family metallo-hydrolase [Phycisphaeraceae bacterium]
MPDAPAQRWLVEHEQESVQRLCEWLRIPSISTDPTYQPDVRRAAEWAREQLAEAGLQAQLIDIGDPPGSGHPIVLATSAGRGPHVLFYGHYDVQPVDPVDLWDSPPFEPVIKPSVPGGPGERIVARGACDDKGQVMMFLEALRAWRETSGAPAGGVRITVLLEGEEESGSANLEAFLRANRARFADCDICLISDTSMLDRGRPAITYGVRGLVYNQVTLHGPDQDLHSGLWGGRCPNPNNELVKILAQLWDERRRVTIPGFYDDVRDLSPQERTAWRDLGVDPAAALRAIGLPPESDIGEQGFSSVEREWARPTAELNGIVGGYTGAGAKTVIPSRAMAKVSFRLVADQDPQAIETAFRQWLRDRTPPGCRWEFASFGTSRGVTVATDSPFLSAAKRAISGATGIEPALIKTGGSIPVAAMLKEQLGVETIFMGFGLDDDRVHSPNEKFELDCFRAGARAHAAMIAEILAMK